MGVVLDLADIQGNILAAYGKQGYPKARCILLRVMGQDDEARVKARRFVLELLPQVTTALRWKDEKSDAPAAASNVFEVARPMVTLNLAFTFYGLLALGVPTRTLRGMPDEFIDGMAKRARMLGDDFVGADWRDQWDVVWQPTKGCPSAYIDEKTPHILVTLNAFVKASPSALDETTRKIMAYAEKYGLRVLKGHNQTGKTTARYQDLSAIYKPDRDGVMQISPTEHFGFVDGISDPVFDGQDAEAAVKREARGNGAVDGEGNWRPLATGEFLLGYPDEAQEVPGAAMPIDFSRNGTFMAYRKLHQNVRAWNDFIDEQAGRFGKVRGIASKIEAKETLIAKMAGRWSDGAPLAKAKNFAAWQVFRAKYPFRSPEWRREVVDYSYRDDPDGATCPMTSHVRRTNPRDALDPWMNLQTPQTDKAAGSVLNNRRRILRRGLPYGASEPHGSDKDEHGVVMMVVCSSLFRQFEFVQQQWVNYGLDARAGNDTCPIVGNHSQGAATPDEAARKRNGPKAKFVIPAAKDSSHPPFIIEGVPQFIETRGGEYFFVPSLTALRMIGMGAVDPT